VAGKLHVVSGSGTCAITATKAADANYLSTTSVSYPVTIAQGSQDISITAPASITYGHTDYDITVEGAVSTGALTFDAGSSTGCSIVAGKLHVVSGSGTCAITASKAGDANYTADTSVLFTVAVHKAPQSITFGSLADKDYGDPAFTVSATASSTLQVSFGASGKCSIVGTTVEITGAGTCTITVSQAGNDDYAAATPVSRTFTIAPAFGTVAYIGQTLVVTSGPNSTTAQVTLSASVVATAGNIAKARVTFMDDVAGSVLAKAVPVKPVEGSTSPTGTANVTVSLTSGKYGAQSYMIRVVLDAAEGPYTNRDQLDNPESGAYATLAVMVPGDTNSAQGDADLTPAAPAGTYGAGTSVHYTLGLQYNKSSRSPQGQVLLGFNLDGYRYYVKSNSINSLACTANATTCRDLTVYTKASIYRIDSAGVTTSIDGNVTLRVDLHDAGPGVETGDKIGFTVLSKSGKLYYSNNWVSDSKAKAWRTMQQEVSAPAGVAVQVN
jgi:hypothetical protein